MRVHAPNQFSAEGPLAPILTPVGTYQANGGDPRYVLKVRGSLRVYRGHELCRVPTLLDIYPDPAHWRLNFPRSRGRVDSMAAGAWLIAACVKAGQCDLPDDLKPRPIGRQRGWKKGVDFAKPA